jgi:hypothetical protein
MQTGKRNAKAGRSRQSVLSSRTNSLPPSNPLADRTQWEKSLTGENAEGSGMVIHETSEGTRRMNPRVDGSPTSTLKAPAKQIAKPKQPFRRAVVVRKQSKAPNSSDVEQGDPKDSKGRTTRNANLKKRRKPRERTNEVLAFDSEVRLHLGLGKWFRLTSSLFRLGTA